MNANNTAVCCLALLTSLAAPLAAGADKPYAGQERRPIKALSSQEIDDYLLGRGMGTSKAAELNHYPGPRHVLDHAAQLELTATQSAAAQNLFDVMARDAAIVGRRIVDKEAELEAMYAGGRASADSTRALVREIAALQAEFRIIHLDAHLAMRDLLTPVQIARYDSVRGYAGGHQGHHRHGH